MPMTPCPACSNEVSTDAATCPKCGHQFKSAGGINMSDPVHVIGIGLAVLILAVVVLAAFMSS